MKGGWVDDRGSDGERKREKRKRRRAAKLSRVENRLLGIQPLPLHFSSLLSSPRHGPLSHEGEKLGVE